MGREPYKKKLVMAAAMLLKDMFTPKQVWLKLIEYDCPMSPHAVRAHLSRMATTIRDYKPNGELQLLRLLKGLYIYWDKDLPRNWRGFFERKTLTERINEMRANELKNDPIFFWFEHRWKQ